jgi:hypothetical protein
MNWKHLVCSLASWTLLAGGVLADVCGTDAPDKGDDCVKACDWAPQRVVYAQADALFMKYQRGASSQPVVILVEDEITNEYPGDTLLTSGEAMVGTQFGPRITLGVLTDECRGWEASYFGLFAGDGSATVFGDDDLAIPGDLGVASLDFFAADRITVTSESELHSFEIQRIRMINDCWTLMGGFRYLRLRDEFNIRSFDEDTSENDYNLRAKNDLFGAQLGLRRSGVVRRLGWDVTGKAGIYGNAASQSQYVTDFPNPDPEYFLRDPVSSSTGQFAFVGELNLGLSLPLNNWLSLRGGYNLLWIEGVALAGNQLDFTDTDPSGVSTNGCVFLHGAHVGVEARW